MFSPMKLTSSASFSLSIKISLRLKIHQAQAKNFCRVLDIRVMEPMKYELEELLYQMGIYLVQAGYAVVVEAAALAVEEPERLQSLTQEFYPEVGRRCRCTWNCAERSLRTATAQAWECNGALISELAMRKITQPPTAGDFLCILRHALLRKKNTEA